MREILFRGKRADRHGWVDGDLLRRNGDVYIFPNDSDNCHEVIHETVGQHTGLHDKNGTKVFEGDIIRCTRGCPHEVYFEQEYGGSFIGGMPAFYLKGIRQGYAWTGKEEVIGNVTDNPELMEE